MMIRKHTPFSLKRDAALSLIGVGDATYLAKAFAHALGAPGITEETKAQLWALIGDACMMAAERSTTSACFHRQDAEAAYRQVNHAFMLKSADYLKEKEPA